tara:strand:- start:1956 stop:4736 length:2781 start_codon:yes stop_codon:yes gene_type:complete
MTPFLEKIAKRLILKYPKDMGKIAVVLPSKRSIIFLKKYLSENIKNPIFLPDFFTVEEFVESISGLKILDNISLKFYLYQTYLKSNIQKKDTFFKFLSWSNILLKDFNEVDRSLVSAKDIFSNLKDMKELEGWDVNEWSFSSDSLTNTQINYMEFYDNIYNWYEDFNILLNQNNFSYEGMAYKKSSELIESVELEWNRVWFVGLNALSNAEKKIIDVLKKNDIARVFWDADIYYYNNKLHEAGSFLREQRNKWSEIDFNGVGDYFSKQKKTFNLIACPKNISQSSVVAEILSSYGTEEINNSTAVVFADEKLLYPVLYQLPNNVNNINITMGSPVKNTQIYSFFDMLFNIQITFKESKILYYKDILNIVRHPIFYELVSKNEVDNLCASIIEKNLVYFDKDLILSNTSISNNLSSYIFEKWESSKIAMDSINNIIIKLHNIFEKKTDLVQIEILNKIYQKNLLITELLKKNSFNVEIPSLYLIFKEFLSKEVLSFEGNPLEGIQMMGLLETRTLDFDNIILLSINEGVIPKGKSDLSFIPYEIRLHFGIPTYKQKDAVFSYHFYRLLQRSKNVNILYNTQTDELGSGEKSRLLTQLISEYPYEINQYVYDTSYSLDLIDKNQITIKSKDLKENINNWSLNVSPTSLNTYIRCKMSFYYRYLLLVEKDNDVVEFAEEEILGNIIHNSLNEGYLKGIILSHKIDDVSEKLHELLRKQYFLMLNTKEIDKGKNYITLKVSEELMNSFLKYEKESVNKLNSRNLDLEIISSELDLSHNLIIDGQLYVIRGKIDRVDTVGETIRILDYKTGKVTQSDLLITDLDDLIDNPKKEKVLQLLIYAYLYIKNNNCIKDSKVVAGILSFKNINKGIIPLSIKDNNTKNVVKFDDSMIDKIECLIISIIRKINSDDFSAIPNHHNFDYCEFNHICTQ